MRRIISILVENEAGALCRIANLFSARGFNIESLSVAPTEDASLSRMTLVTYGTEEIIEQVVKQLNKLIEVVKLIDLTEGNHIERELMLVKVKAVNADERAEVERLTSIFRGHVIDVTNTTFTIEMAGAGNKLDGFINVIDKERLLEVVRSGVTGIGRGAKALRI